MIAARFRTVGWVAGVATAALACYLASQSVAAERAVLARVDARIALANADIHRLHTEIGTRGRMSQLDRWNAEVLALQAPGARQFLASEVQLAGLGAPRPLPLDPDVVAAKGAVEQAAYARPVAPPMPAPASTERSVPLLRAATYVRERPDRLSDDAPVPVVKVSLEHKPEPAVAPVAVVKDSVSETPRVPKAKRAPLDLLPADIDTLAAAERKPSGAHR